MVLGIVRARRTSRAEPATAPCEFEQHVILRVRTRRAPPLAAPAVAKATSIARFDAAMFNGRIPGDIARQLPAVKWIAVNGHVDDGVRGTVRAETRDDAAAKDLSEVVRGFMALARLQSGQNSDFAAVINSLQLSEHGSTVTLDFAVPSDAIDALPMLHRGMPRRDHRGDAPPRADGPPPPGTPPL